MYGSYSQNSSHHQPVSGPPQQEWQQPPPDVPFQNNQPWHIPDHTASASYNPGTYGPMPSVNANSSATHQGNLDTSSWGVRYNQNQQPSNTTNPNIPPPLPPRPSSSVGYSNPPLYATTGPLAPVASPPLWSTTPQYHYGTNPATTQEYQQHSHGGIYQDPNLQSHGAVPPPPPPFPPAYLSEQQKQQQQHAAEWPQQPDYSHPSPTPNFDPQPQPQDHGFSRPGYHETTNSSYPSSSASASVSNHAHITAQPLPAQGYAGFPIPHNHDVAPTHPVTSTASPVATTSSALGSLGPSDWEHFTPHNTSYDDPGCMDPKVNTGPKTSNAAVPPPQHAWPQTVSAPISQSSSQHPRSESPQSQRPPVSPIAESFQTGNAGSAQRVDSLDSNFSVSTTHSQSIDGVIKAWSQPISPEGRLQTQESQDPELNRKESSTRGPPGTTISIQTELDSKSIGPSRANSLKGKSENFTVKTKVVDPYEDLEPWYRSSLMRYVAMLRREAVAESDEERYNIFTAFVSKESKLREVLYSLEPIPPSESLNIAAGSEKTGFSRDSVGCEQHKPTLCSVDKTEPQNEAGKVATDFSSRQSAGHMSDQSTEDENDVSYSPGGRPILFPITHGDQDQQDPPAQNLGKSRSSSADPRHSQELSIGTGDSLSRLPTNDSPRSPSARVGVPAVGASKVGKTPAYVPFRYTEGPQRGSEKLVFEQPAYQAYSALRQASAGSGRTMTQGAMPSIERAGKVGPMPTGGVDVDKTFLGLMREKSGAYRHRKGTTSPSPSSLPETLRSSKTREILSELQTLVPASTPDKSESVENAALREDMDKFPDSLEFAQEMTGVWDRESKSRRERLDEGRLARQEESERRIDSLFNDKEIGYSDITTLEEEFRQNEAKTQLDEERREFDNYVTNAFKPVEERLKRDVSSLKAKYDKAIGLLDSETQAISRMTNSRLTRNSQLSYTMRNAVNIFQKLELRYQKLVEVALEQERRRKRTERRPLVFIGDSVALKQLDGDFESMESRNIHDSAKDSDERANKLMDYFDEASMSGLAETQSLLDDISAKVQKMDPTTIRSSGIDPAEIRPTLESASMVVKMLAADSESILYSFVMADRILNDADYEVSVVEARLSNADAEVFRRLEVEKKKEDGKIQVELDSRLKGVKKGPQEIAEEIVKILEAAETLGRLSPPARAASSSPLPEPVVLPEPNVSSPPGRTVGDEQKERLRIALETAKRRNAAKGLS